MEQLVPLQSLKRGVALLTAGALVAFSIGFTAQAASTDTKSAELRVSLNALLKEHVNLSLATLRSVYDDSADVVAAQTVLDQNTVELADTISSVYGNNAGDNFLELWRAHIGFFVDYTLAVKSADTTVKQQAEDDLEQYAQNAADFFSTAIPTVTEADVITGARTHAELLTASVDAYASGDYRLAYSKQRQAVKQIQGLADLLAAGIADQYPDQFDVMGMMHATATSAIDLRVALDGLLREHVDLALDVLRNAYTGSAAYDASLEALDDNTVELAETIGAVYGSSAKTQFMDLWREHIGFFADHTAALKVNNQADVGMAEEDLADYADTIAQFFSGAIPAVIAVDVEAGAQTHVDQLTRAMVQYDNGNYLESYEIERDANKHIANLAAMLSAGIVAQFPTDYAMSSSSSMSYSSSSSAMSSRYSSSVMSLPFPDVAIGTDLDSIIYLKERGVISGNPDGNFAPHRALNRAEFVKIAVLAQMNEAEIGTDTSCFPDVDANTWYARYVCKAEALGIVKGYPNGMFGPEKNIQVEEAYKVAAEIFFGSEVQVTDPWYLTYMSIAQQHDFDVSVDAGQEITRNEMAGIISHAMQASY